MLQIFTLFWHRKNRENQEMTQNTLIRAHFALVTHETRSAGVLSALNEVFARLDSSTTGSKTHGLFMIPIFIMHFVHHMWKNVWDAFKCIALSRQWIVLSEPFYSLLLSFYPARPRRWSEPRWLSPRRSSAASQSPHAWWKIADINPLTAENTLASCGLIPVKASYMHRTQRTNCVGGARTHARLAPPIVCSARSCLDFLLVFEQNKS